MNCSNCNHVIHSHYCDFCDNLGKKYVWGATGPNSFDCSGLMQYIYKKVGINLNRVSRDQATQGIAVSKSNLQPGDLIIFKNQSLTAIGHVGIYIGNSEFIHASTTALGVFCPFAIFSPALLYVIPKLFII